MSRKSLPPYDGQDIESYTTLMTNAVASRLKVAEPKTHLQVYVEDELRAEIEEIKPDALILLDEVVAAYRNWIEARKEAGYTVYDESDGDAPDNDYDFDLDDIVRLKVLRSLRRKAESLQRDLSRLISS